jgi:hypothetical protein
MARLRWVSERWAIMGDESRMTQRPSHAAAQDSNPLQALDDFVSHDFVVCFRISRKRNCA